VFLLGSSITACAVQSFERTSSSLFQRHSRTSMLIFDLPMLVRSRRIAVCDYCVHCGNPCVFQQEFVKFREQLIVLLGNCIHSVVIELGMRSHHCAHVTPLGFRCAQATSAFAVQHVWISLWLSPMAYQLYQAHGAGGA
jgi:hypothetical protein